MLSYLLPLIPVAVGVGSLVINILLIMKVNNDSKLIQGIHQRLIKISEKLNA